MAATIEAVGEEKRKGPPFGKFGTERPAPAGKVPRRVDPVERAPDGVKRFKVWLRDDYRAHVENNIQYVLAKSADEARDFFKKEVNLADVVKRLKGADAKVEDAFVHVTALAD